MSSYSISHQLSLTFHQATIQIFVSEYPSSIDSLFFNSLETDFHVCDVIALQE